MDKRVLTSTDAHMVLTRLINEIVTRDYDKSTCNWGFCNARLYDDPRMHFYPIDYLNHQRRTPLPMPCPCPKPCQVRYNKDALIDICIELQKGLK